MKKTLTLITILSFFFSAKSQTLELTQYASGFNNLVDIAHAGDDRLFIVEQAGRIKIFQNGSTLSANFLDINNVVTNSLDERGLLGLAFHPDYANNGFFYVNYVSNNDVTTIARYSRDSSDPNLADPNSAVIILTINQPDWNHNGGCLKFGPDGYLYIGTGDGGSGGDPWNNAQKTDVLLGKMLRIDVDNGTPYSIPSDNPFVNDSNVLDEIWATGLRNPWRYSFDKSTGDLWIGDVGQSGVEEVDFQSASSTGGENYGWKCYEGTDVYSSGGCNGSYVDPVYEVQHAGFSGPCSITGGFVYRGTESPDLVGKYICADFCTGDFYLVESDGSGGFTGQELGVLQPEISTFGEDVNGELYCATHSGVIYKISSDACANVALPTFTSNENILTANGSYTSYQWLLDGNEIAGATDPSYTATISGNYALNVIDNDGCNITSTEMNIVITSITNIPTLETFSVTPNPFKENLIVDISVSEQSDFEINILDNSGKLVFTKKATVLKSYTQNIDTQLFSNGVYFLHLKSEQGSVIKKVVKN